MKKTLMILLMVFFLIVSPTSVLAESNSSDLNNTTIMESNKTTESNETAESIEAYDLSSLEDEMVGFLNDKLKKGDSSIDKLIDDFYKSGFRSIA